MKIMSINVFKVDEHTINIFPLISRVFYKTKKASHSENLRQLNCLGKEHLFWGFI